jgi:hypothetical protein
VTCYKDLDPIDYFPVGNDILLQAIGWLGKELEFQTGRVGQQFFNKLCESAENPWQPFISAGFHTCDLCQFPFSEQNLWSDYFLSSNQELINRYLEKGEEEFEKLRLSLRERNPALYQKLIAAKAQKQGKA